MFDQFGNLRNPAAYEAMNPVHAGLVAMIERPLEAPMDIPLPDH
jgi:hypothetical protein